MNSNIMQTSKNKNVFGVYEIFCRVYQAAGLCPVAISDIWKIAI